MHQHRAVSHRAFSQRACRLGAAISAVALLAGCGVSQMAVRVEVKAPPNPPKATAVHLAEVTDSREFRPSGADPAPHQLAGEGFGNPALHARSIAQIRAAGGNPIADLLLPEGDTATSLVRDALTRAFREGGYAVLEPGERGFAEAIPVHADVRRFWAWNTGTWTFSFEFESLVLITSPVPPFEDGEEVRGYMKLRSAWAARPASFENTTQKGLDDFIANVKERIEAGRGAEPGWVEEYEAAGGED